MKHYLFLLVAILLLVSCKMPQQHKPKESNPMVELLKSYNDKQYDYPNDIAKKEALQNREDSLKQLQDSLCIFTNIKGSINDISSEESEDGKSIVLSYDIKIAPDKYFEVTLNCTRIISKDSLENDSIYKFVKAQDEFSQVYVDGILAISHAENKFFYDPLNYDRELAFSYPKYVFNVVDIRAKESTLSKNLMTSIKLFKDSYDYLLKDMRHEVYKKSIFDEKTAKCNKSADLLTKPEFNYLGRYIEACMMDLYR